MSASNSTTASSIPEFALPIIVKLNRIEKTDYLSEEGQEEIQELLKSGIPALETAGTDAAAKVQILTLRSRAKLLTKEIHDAASSSASSSGAGDDAATLKKMLKEIESDISKALKINSKDKAAWLVMSEILWRKKSYREARDAAESALRSQPDDVQALCQASRLARVVSTTEKSADKKPALIATSIQRAKQALAVDPMCSEAWLCLGLTLYHEAGSTKMTFAGLRKALSALTQATRCDMRNADAYLNRGLVEHSLTQFGDAVVSFETAWKLDPTLKPSCEPLFKRSHSMLMLLQSRLRVPMADCVKTFGAELKACMKSAQAASLAPPAGTTLTGLQSAFADAIEQAKTKGGSTSASNDASSATKTNNTQACVVSVLRMISSSSEVPLVYECIDQGKNLFCVAVCNLAPAAINLNNPNKKPALTIKIPPAEVAILHQSPQIPPEKFTTEIQKTFSRVAGGLQPLHCIFCDASSVYIDSKPVAAEHVISATINAEAL